MPTVKRGDLTISLLEDGAGPTALLLHSGGLGARQWLRLAARLKSFRHVLAPDLRGYGASTPWPGHAPFDFTVDLGLIDALLTNVRPPFDLVGHSYGGLLALQFARARPRDVRSLTVYEPVAFGVLHEPPDPDGQRDLDEIDHDGVFLADATGGSEAWVERFVDYWNGQGAWRALSENTRESFLKNGRKAFLEVRSVMMDRTPTSAYAVIDAPTLLLSGADSTRAAHRVLDRLESVLPRSRRITFPETGHMGPVTDATAVNAAILAHIDAAGG